MEKLKVKSGKKSQESSKKCSIKKDSSEILAADLENRLSLKNTNGLLNGLASDEYSNCKHECKFENEAIDYCNNKAKKKEGEIREKNEKCMKDTEEEQKGEVKSEGTATSSKIVCATEIDICNNKEKDDNISKDEAKKPKDILHVEMEEKENKAVCTAEDTPTTSKISESPEIRYVQYESELQMPMIMKIIQKDLSEPYSIYTYRYFIHNWPKLCFLAMCGEECVGAIVCKLDLHRKVIRRGYIAMLAVDEKYRKRSIGSTLVRRAIEEMIAGDADEVVLETEVTNKPALRLYEALGFVRDKRLFRYYLNGVDALRLKLWLR